MKRIKSILRKLLSIKLFFPILALIAIVAIIAGVYFFNQYQKAQKLLGSSTQVNSNEVDEIVKQIGKLIELPKENPTAATVSDVTKLIDQPFFAKAQNGDKVLIYSGAKKAILYRPSENKIIEVSSVSLGQNPANTTAAEADVSPTPAPKVKVAIYNGTTTAGLTKSTGDDLTEKFENIDVVDRENASKSDYENTIVIDLSGKNKAIADLIAKELQGSVGSIPEGETKPEGADILIILGRK